MLKFFVLHLILLALVNAIPQLIPLYKFTSLAALNVNGVEAGAKLYLASNDNVQYLKNIKLTSGATSITLDQISDLNDDGTPKVFQIVSDLTVSTTNSDDITRSLYGNLYITSRQQADDSDFSVYVIKDSQTISKNAMKSTVVVLNTKLVGGDDGDIYQPRRTSYVTNINQSPNTNIYFQSGIPPVNWHDVTNNTFFKNPIMLQNATTVTRHFFDHVEPLQVNLDYWYFTVMGPVNMRMENKYVSSANYTTTAVSTTGLIVNSGIYQEHLIFFTPDLTRDGAAGVFTKSFAISNVDVAVYYVTGANFSSSLAKTEGYYTWIQGAGVRVNSTTYTPGTFYVQYFSFAGDLLPITTTLPPTAGSTGGVSTSTAATSTTKIPTTTQGVSSMFGFEVLAVSLAIALHL